MQMLIVVKGKKVRFKWYKKELYVSTSDLGEILQISNIRKNISKIKKSNRKKLRIWSGLYAREMHTVNLEGLKELLDRLIKPSIKEKQFILKEVGGFMEHINNGQNKILESCKNEEKLKKLKNDLKNKEEEIDTLVKKHNYLKSKNEFLGSQATSLIRENQKQRLAIRELNNSKCPICKLKSSLGA